MITVQLSGGMGNQMFQYALAKTLAHKHNTSVILDLTALNHRIKRFNYIFREFDLPIFKEVYTTTYLSHSPNFLKNTSFFIQTGINLIHKRLYPQTYVTEKSQAFDQSILSSPNRSYLSGYWQSPNYFESIAPEIRKIFTTFTLPLSPQSQKLLEKINSTNAVCMNFRRTDYVSVAQATKFHGVMGNDYYSIALQTIVSKTANPHFYIFSDDITWCKENIKLPYPTTFVGHEYAGEKFSDYLQLMIACKHYIIPNSTFAWWAAWLNHNPEKIVIAPKNWFADPTNKIDIIPSTWIRL